MKIYKAKTIMGFYVKLKNGGQKYLNFEPTNDGKSMLAVDNPEIMEAIESMEEFGKYISVWMDNGKHGKNNTETKTTKKQQKKQEEKPASDVAEAVTEKEPEPEPEINAEEKEGVKTFPCLEDAREWVNETFGTPKKKLMSKDAVIGAAAENGVDIAIED